MQRRTVILGGTAATLFGVGAAASVARMGSSSDYAAAMEQLRTPIAPTADIRNVVRSATLAANNHNTQPWRFVASRGSIRMVPDFSRRTPAVDPDDHHLFVSLGCAAENLALAASAAGLPGELSYDTNADGSVRFEYSPGVPRPSSLSDAILRRQTTRANFSGRPVDTEGLRLLSGAAGLPGVSVSIITDRRKMERIKALVLAGNSKQMADGAFVRELKSWMRFNPRSALNHGDGLYSACSGNPTFPTWLGELMFDLAFRAAPENKKYESQIDTSAGLVVFGGRSQTHESWVNVGRACQRFALQATALGLKTSFINQPVEVREFRPELAEVAGIKGTRPDILMRFGYGPTLPMSPRRPLEAVLEMAKS